MISRAVYKRQPGRRLLTALAGTALIVGSFVAGSAALAVNNTGAFELDGNAVTSHAGTGAPDDADRVCYQHAITPIAQGGLGETAAQATALCFSNGDTATPTGTVGATSATWVDSTTNLEIFTGGGSKDPQDPQNSWLWKPADTIPDKDTLIHAFAARYSLTPSPSTCPSTDPTCEVVFFGVDRFDNSGDAQLGFWFFKNKVSTTNTASGGGFAFSGHHVNGDLLVISDFSVGGTTSTIAAYFWDSTCGSDNTAANKIVNNPGPGQCGANNLRLQSISTAANCATSAATAAFCGIANGADGTIAPWSFTDKSGNHTYLKGEYYEAGVNLSALGIGNECFATVEGESRSSTSPTATLKDFVLGQFQNCSATAVTTPSSTSVSPGTPVTDHFVVTGLGTGSPPFPSSPPNVVFSMCGPIATGICDSSDAAHTAATFGATKPLTHTATQGQSEATSDQVNTSGSPLTPGRYCFAGSWAGDSNYTSGASDNSSGECFTVIQIPTTTVTTPSDSSGTALGTGTLTLGTALYDKAVVTGTAAGGNPPGAVNFFICNPSQVSGLAGAEVCADGAGTALTGNPRTLVADSGSTPPTSSVLSSPAVNANSAGVWCFRATYVPSGTTYTGSSDDTHGECVKVGPENTSTKTTPSITGSAALQAGGTSVTDTAVVTATDNADGTPTGSITFFLCDPATVTANSGDCHTGGTQVGSAKTATAVAASNPPASTATSDSATATSVGTWCFRAVYTPGGANGANYNGSSDGSTGECFTITDSTSGVSAQTWLPNDSGTVSSTGGTALNGTLSLQLYTGSTCTAGNEVSGQLYSKTLTNASTAADRTITSTNSTFKVSASTSVSWKVTFSSTDANVTGSSHCESTSLTITN